MQTIRSVATAVVAVCAAVALCLLSTVGAGIQLLTSTLLVLGGSTNPMGLTPLMSQQLGGDPYYPGPAPNPRLFPPGVFGQGYIDTQNNPGSPYFGWDYRAVEWPAEISLPLFGGLTYAQSQQHGVINLNAAIADVLPTLGQGEKAVALGYSSSANVVVREMRALQSQPGGAPATDELGFILVGNPNRPNGGILQRFPGLYIPFIDVNFDGSTPTDTPYQTTDISWEYEAVADFPNYPINLVAVANSLTAILLHGNYYPARIDGPRARPDTTVGNITYVTLKAPHLPLLLPLYDLGFPKPLLDLVEPTLTVIVDWGYDRSISPGTPTTARLIPRINPVTAIHDLVKSVGEGVGNFIEDLAPKKAAPTPGTLAALPADTDVAVVRAAGQTDDDPAPAATPEPTDGPRGGQVADDPAPAATAEVTDGRDAGQGRSPAATTKPRAVSPRPGQGPDSQRSITRHPVGRPAAAARATTTDSTTTSSASAAAGESGQD